MAKSPGDAFRQPRYQAWEGNNKFYCSGRIMGGPYPKPVFFTSVLIVGPVLAALVQT